MPSAAQEHVQANPGDDRRQPPTQILDRARIGAGEAEPRFLNCVISVSQGTKHPIGHPGQVGTALLKALNQPIALDHLSRSAFAHCSGHIASLSSVISMTNETTAM